MAGALESTEGKLKDKGRLPPAWERAVSVFARGGGRFREETREHYRRTTRRFAWFAVDLEYPDPGSIDLTLLEVFGAMLGASGYKAATVANYKSVVRSLVAWLRAHGANMPEPWKVAQVFPVGRVTERPVLPPPSRYLGGFLRDIEDPRDRAVLLLCAAAGLRTSEVGALKMESFRETATGWMVEVDGKGGRRRVLPMVEDLVEALELYLYEDGRNLGKGTGPFFLPKDRAAEWRGSDGLGRQAVYRIVRRAGEALGIKTNPRELRHGFAVYFLGNGGNISELRALLGHTDLTPTARYLETLRLVGARATIERQVEGWWEDAAALPDGTPAK